MAGKFSFSPEEYQSAAIKWRKELLMLPIIGIGESLKYMTSRPGIRYRENVGEISADAQFAPYKSNRTADADLKLKWRTLETYFGNVVTDFEPNTAVSTLLGTGATKGDGQMQTPTAQHVLAQIARKLGEHLNDALWSAVRNAEGDTTADLFDGFDTITAKEITEGNISADAGNYVKLTEAITPQNAEDVAKEILFNLDPRLRAQECYMYCSQSFVDAYNEAYLNRHGGIPYNTQYGQRSVEGSDGRLKFLPLYNKADSKYIHICPKSNMLVGFDQMGDVESIMVKEYKPFVLTYIATMFFGCQFETLDKRRMKVVELATP